MKKILAFYSILSFLICSTALASGRFVDGTWIDDNQFTSTLTFTNAITINQTTAGEEILHVTCTNGAYGSCSCYGTTVSAKIGAIQVNINGSQRWINFYEGPN